MLNGEGRLRFLRRATDRPRQRFRRGVYVLPSLFTLGNMFCGYACVVYAMRGEYETAAPFIGLALVLDMLDGWIARLTGTASAFGLEFDSLADVISFGIAPALLMVSTIRFRSFKNFDLQSRRPYRILLLIALGIMLITWLHRYVLVVMAYSYLASPFIGLAISRLRRRGARGTPDRRTTM